MRKTSLSRILFGCIFSVLLFLLLLGVLNIVALFVFDNTFHTIVGFLNYNLLLVLFISFVIFIGNLFEIMIFPFNLVYPVANSFASLLVLVLILRVVRLIGHFVDAHIYYAVYPFYIFALFAVPIIVLIVGYVRIFARGVKMVTGKKKKQEVKKKGVTKKADAARKSASSVAWSDVGEEFKQALFELGRLLKESIADSRKDCRKKK